MFLRIIFLLVSVGMAFVEESDDPSVLMPVEPYDTSLLQFSLTGATIGPLWKNLRDAEITASSSLNQFSLPENLKGIHHNIWVAAADAVQWLTFTFAQVQTIDGMRVWNVQKKSAFQKYMFQMSPNDGFDWYDIKKGTGIDQVCCEYQEILFPVAHANMFRLLMEDNFDPTVKLSMSYIEFHFLPEPAYLCPYYAVPFNNFCYAVMDRTLYDDGKNVGDRFCQDSTMALPLGWDLAIYSDGVRDNVVHSAYYDPANSDHQRSHWGTDYVVFADGQGYATNSGAKWVLPLASDGSVNRDVVGFVRIGGKYKPKWCLGDGDGSGGRVADITAVVTGLEVPLDSSQCSCTSRLLIQMEINSTRRFTPPFVSRNDDNNNFVFEKTI